MGQVKKGDLPFHAVTGENLTMPRPGDPDPPRTGKFSSPDALLTPSYMAEAAQDPGIQIEPAWKVSTPLWNALRHLSSIAGCLLPGREI